MRHVRHDHQEIVIRRAQQVRAEHDRERIGRHLVLLLEVRYAVQMLDDTAQQVEVGSRESLHDYPRAREAGVELFDLCASVSVYHERRRCKRRHTHSVDDVMIRISREHRLRQNAEPRLDHVAHRIDIRLSSNRPESRIELFAKTVDLRVRASDTI